MNQKNDENITIIWETGQMTIYPPYFFQGCKLISKFKKVARLSYESDMCFNTNTFKQWRQAIQKEINQAMEDVGSGDRRISQINSKISRLKRMFKIMDEFKEKRKSKSKRLF